jgi:hypothetical protein
MNILVWPGIHPVTAIQGIDLPPRNETSSSGSFLVDWAGRKGGKAMARRMGMEKAIRILREVEVLQSQGSTIGDACRKLAVAEHTYYRWKKEYGRLSVDQARRLKELETENGRLKKLVADLSLDNAILREAASGNS